MRYKIKVFLIIFGIITCLGISNSMIGKVSADMETAAQIAAEMIIKDWNYISTAYSSISSLVIAAYDYYSDMFWVDTTGAFGLCYLGFSSWSTLFDADGPVDFYIFDFNGFYNWFYYDYTYGAIIRYEGYYWVNGEGALSFPRAVNKYDTYFLVIDNDNGYSVTVDADALQVLNNPAHMMMLIIIIAATVFSANAPAQQQNLTWLWILITILAIAVPPAIIVPIVVSRKKTL